MTTSDRAEIPAGKAHSGRPRPSAAAALAAVVGPFTRVGDYYAASWRDYLDRDPRGLPIARPTIALAAHAFRDEIALFGLRARRPVSDVHVFERIGTEVAAALELYDRRSWLAHPERFFAKPPQLVDVAVRQVTALGRQYERLTFDSGYEPYSDEPGKTRWQSYTGNDAGYALMLRHRADRPWLICVHGAEMGRAAIDLTLFRAWHLHDDLGLNVVLPVLPMHGPRGRGLPKGAVFPGEDVMDDVHATAQAVWDIRRLLSWIRAEQPKSAIGLNGLSLGGYVSSLVASLDDGLACAILGVPVVDLIAVLTEHAHLRNDDPRRLIMTMAEPIGRMLSPLSMKPRVPIGGRFIYAGIADRLVHPRDQVARLWDHWGKPEIVWYPGGHTGFFESRPVQRFVDAALAQSGMLDRQHDAASRQSA